MFFDGINILRQFRKKRNKIFNKQKYQLFDIQKQIKCPLFDNINFIGKIDIILKEKNSDKYLLIDIKTTLCG